MIVGLQSYLMAFVLVLVVSIIFILMMKLWNVDDKQILKITIPEDIINNAVQKEY